MNGNIDPKAHPQSRLRRLLYFIRLWFSVYAEREISKIDPRAEAELAASVAPAKRWVRRRWVRYREIWIAIVTGLVAGAVLLVFQNVIDNSRFQQSVSIENIRYVRELSHPGSQYRPFSSMDLSGQILSGLIVDNADLRGADLSGTEMFDISARGTKFEGANFDKAGIYSANFTGAVLDDVRFHTQIWDSDFTGSTFRPKKLRFGQSGNSGETGIVNSKFTGAHFEGASLTRWIFSRSSLRDAHMENAKLGSLNKTDLRGTNFTGATMPRGFTDNCYDDSTVWPAGFDPPPNNPEHCGEPKKGNPSRAPTPWRPDSRDTGVGNP